MTAGILLFYFYPISPSLLYSSFILLLLLFVIIEWMNKRQPTPLLSNTASLLYMGLLFYFGMLRLSVHHQAIKPDIHSLIQVMSWEEIEVYGDILQRSENSSGQARWDLQVSNTYIGDLHVAQNYRARILIDNEEQGASLGDHVRFKGTIIPIPQKRNPHDFDYAGYLRSRGITVQLKLVSDLQVTPNSSKLEWVWWRERALNLLRQNFDQDTFPLASALLLGYKQELDAPSKTAFARAGLSHIMAVSGLHVGFLVAPFWIGIPFFWARKYGKVTGFIFLLFILWVYAGITGFSASVMRASVMAAFLTYARLFHKNSDSINLTAAAALVLLMIDPDQLFMIGFQLSFSAVFIILLLLPVLRSCLPYQLRVNWYGKPLMIIFITLIVQFGLYPLQVFYFGEISFISPLANALFVPLLGIVVPLSLFSLLVASVSPAAAYILNYPAHLFLTTMHSLVLEMSTLDWAWTTSRLSSNFIFILWLCLIFTFASLRIPALRWKYLNAVLISFCVLVSVQLVSNLRPATLFITYFDVGQGDAAFIQTPSGKNILLDTGVWSPGYNSGRSIILPHLRAIGIDHLDAIILSHPHADHIGGINELLQSIPIKKIYNSGYLYDSSIYRSYLNKARDLEIPVASLQAGDTLALDPSLLMLVIGPFPNTYSTDPNQHSIMMKVIYGNTSFFFTGDAGAEQESKVLETYGTLLDSDILKVGHHGSRSSSTSSFLAQITPIHAIISLSDQNKFGHPHPDALLRLQQSHAGLLFTSLEGAIQFESDGRSVYRRPW